MFTNKNLNLLASMATVNIGLLGTGNFYNVLTNKNLGIITFAVSSKKNLLPHSDIERFNLVFQYMGIFQNPNLVTV